MTRLRFYVIYTTCTQVYEVLCDIQLQYVIPQVYEVLCDIQLQYVIPQVYEVLCDIQMQYVIPLSIMIKAYLVHIASCTIFITYCSC